MSDPTEPAAGDTMPPAPGRDHVCRASISGTVRVPTRRALPAPRILIAEDDPVSCLVLERTLRGWPSYIRLRTLLACLGQLGRTEQAKAVIAESAKLAPANAERLWEITTRYADPAHRDHLVEGLRKAGSTV